MFDSSTVMTPSLPTLSMASAISSPIWVSPAEMAAVAAICSLVSTSLADFSSVSVIFSTAFSMPRFQGERVGARRDVAQALANQRLGQHGGGGGAVARDVVGLLGDFLDQLSADLLVRVLQLDLLGDGHAIVGDRGAPHFFSRTTLRPLGPNVTSYRVGEGIQAPLEAATGLFVIRNRLGHCEVIPPDWGWHVLLVGRSARDGRLDMLACAARPHRPDLALTGRECQLHS